MRKSVKRCLLMGAGLVGTAAVLTHGLTRYMVRMALDREGPKAARKLARRIIRGVCQDPLYRRALEDGLRLREIPHETVEITAGDGEVLVGHWFPASHPKRIILAMHGWRSVWFRDFGGISGFWRDNGCSVLYAEQRGQNASGGQYMGFGMLERYDCLDWLKWLESSQGTRLPVYLAGVSMGASTVLMAAGLNLPPQVRGIIADCGFTSAHAIWSHVCRDGLHMPYFLHRAEAEHLCRKKLHMGTRDYTVPQALKKCRVPVFFAHGLEDDFVPVEMTFENYKACAAPKRLLVIPGAGHGMSFYVDRESYTREMLDFWREWE